MVDLDNPTCPFCSFSDEDASFVVEHIHFCHPEGGANQASGVSHPPESTDRAASPFSPEEGSTDQYVDCPLGCGEAVTAAELSTHLDLHVAEGIALDERDPDSAPFNSDRINIDRDVLSYQEDSLGVPASRRNGKRDAERDFARTNSSKPGRARSPPRRTGPDGARRLGVGFFIFHGEFEHELTSELALGIGAPCS